MSWCLPLAAAYAATAAALPAVPPPAHQGEARLLVDQAELLPAMLAMIGRAKRSVVVDYFILGGAPGRQVVAALAERQATGVQVRVLLDPAMGSLPALRAETHPVLDALRTARLPVRLFAPPPHATGMVRDHHKLVAVDGAEAIVSSMNLAGPLLECHDVGVWLTGNAARAIARDAWHAWAAAPAMAPEPDWPEPDWPAAEPRGEAAIRVWTTQPTQADRPARGAMMAALAGAGRAVDVMMLKLDDRAAIAALTAAHRRGVAVRVLLDPGRQGRVVPGGWAPEGLFNLEAAQALAAAGVPMRWYRPRPHELALHAKAACVDGRRLLAGTTNWTPDGFDRNRETMLEVVGGGAPARFTQVFDAAWGERADEPAFAPAPLLAGQAWLYRGLRALAE